MHSLLAGSEPWHRGHRIFSAKDAQAREAGVFDGPKRVRARERATARRVGYYFAETP